MAAEGRVRVLGDLTGLSWEEIAQRARAKHRSQGARSNWSLTTLMLESVGAAKRAGFTGTMREWSDAIRDTKEIKLKKAPPPPPPPADNLDDWLDQL